MTNWRQDGRGVRVGGDVGGDDQATEAWSVRYRNTREPEEGLYSIITVYYYGTGKSLDGGVSYIGPYSVTTLVEYLVCTDVGDPGGTEVWSDYNETKPSSGSFMLSKDAEKAAKDYAGHLEPYGISLPGIWQKNRTVEWDGTPKHDRDSTGWLITA